MPNSLTVKIDDLPITKVSSAKFLGVVINETLTWSDHIQTLKQKILKNAGIISYLRKNMPLTVLKSLYLTLVQPYLFYCNIVWGIHRSVEFDKLLTCQKKIIRMITNSQWRSHTAPLFKDLRILPLNLLNDFLVCCFMYSITHNLILPRYLNNMFCANTLVHSHNTKSKNNIHILNHKLTVRTHTIRFYGPKLWNSIPEQLHNVPSLNIFKKQYRSTLLSSLDQ